MQEIILMNIIQVVSFFIGTILIIVAGKQDNKTRKPIYLIPALMFIGLSAGLETFFIIALFSWIIFFLPNDINKILGKADLLLFAGVLIIILFNQNLLITLIEYFTLTAMLILLIYKKQAKKEIP